MEKRGPMASAPPGPSLLGESHETAGDLRAQQRRRRGGGARAASRLDALCPGRFLAQQGDVRRTPRPSRPSTRGPKRRTGRSSSSRTTGPGPGRGGSFTGPGRPERGDECIERVRQERPGDALGRTYWPRLYQEMEQEAASRAEYEAALAAFPDVGLCPGGDRQSLIIVGDYQRAESCWRGSPPRPGHSCARLLWARLTRSTAAPGLARVAYEGLLVPDRRAPGCTPPRQSAWTRCRLSTAPRARLCAD